MREALIVWGGWSGHEPERCAPSSPDCSKGKAFKVRVESSTAAFADPALSGHEPDRADLDDVDDREGGADNLTQAVEGGVGLAGCHGGMCDAFREAAEYQFMCGGQWVAHPGNIIDYRVNITRPDDPITAGIDDFD